MVHPVTQITRTAKELAIEFIDEMHENSASKIVTASITKNDLPKEGGIKSVTAQTSEDRVDALKEKEMAVFPQDQHSTHDGLLKLQDGLMISNKDRQKIQIAKNFMALRDPPFSVPEKEKNNDYYLTIYGNLVGGVYGDCQGTNAKHDQHGDQLIVEATEFEIEICAFESISGNDEIFDFTLIK